MIHVATLRMVAPPGRRDEVLRALRWLAGPTRSRPGCIECRILQDLDDGDALVLVEEWTSAEALVRHLRSADYRRLLAVADLAAEPPEIHFDRVVERRGLELVAEIRGCGAPAGEASTREDSGARGDARCLKFRGGGRR